MATLSSKLTPSGVATAAQGALADSAVQPNDSPTLADITLNTGSSSLLTFQDSTNTNGYKLRANVSNVADYGFLIEDLAGGDLLKVQSNGTVTATSFAGDGSALTGVGPSTTAGAVGTYAYLVNTGVDTSISQGTSIAGSSLRYSGHSNDSLTTSTDNWSVSHTAGGANPSGTWQSMGSRGSSVGRNYFQTLYVRIA